MCLEGLQGLKRLALGKKAVQQSWVVPRGDNTVIERNGCTVYKRSLCSRHRGCYPRFGKDPPLCLSLGREPGE